MPVYFFNIRRRGDQVGVDEAGIDLPDLDVARTHAVELAREIMGDAVLAGELELDRTVEVVDQEGSTVLVLRFADAVAIEAAPSGGHPPPRGKRHGAARRSNRAGS